MFALCRVGERKIKSDSVREGGAIVWEREEWEINRDGVWERRLNPNLDFAFVLLLCKS